jgi:hypothetical protein
MCPGLYMCGWDKPQVKGGFGAIEEKEQQLP